MAIKPLNSVGGFSVGEVPANVILANGDITTGNANFTGNVSATYYFGNGAYLTGIDATSIQNGNSNVKVYANANVEISAYGNANIVSITGTGANISGTLNVTGNATLPDIIASNLTSSTNSNINIEPNGTGLVVIANTAGGATAVALGDPTLGNLVSNAVTLSNSSSVSNAIAQLNVVLGKLVPPSPPNFPDSQTISVQSVSSYRMTDFTQTDNTPGGNKNVAPGTTVTTVRRSSSYTTGNVTTTGPGDSGFIAVRLNGVDAGNTTLTSSLIGNGTYDDLVIYNNYDYHDANVSITPGFWSVFSARAAGTVTQGWNEVYISDSAAGNTNTTVWYYDASAPGTPQFSSVAITPPSSPTYEYSSTVPHYTSSNAFDITFSVNRLSGDMYPTVDTFITGTAGGALGAPASVTYAQAGVTTPLAHNLYVASGTQPVATTATVISGFGSSSGAPSVSALNSYATGTQSLPPSGTVLYKTGTASSTTRIEEANVYIGSTIGSGSGLAYRIVNPGSGNTPVYTGTETAFNSQSSTLQSYDATIVGNVLKHDQTDYSTGYLPAGPNLSTGRSGTQYFTFKFIRTSVSKFDVKWSGNIAGMWVALPGSVIDSTSGSNGWINMATAYAGAGIPGSNTGAGGNGSDGCALGGVAPVNSVQTNKSVTATFGTVSSSSTATNEIYVRVALTSGQTVTALSLQTASN